MKKLIVCAMVLNNFLTVAQDKKNNATITVKGVSSIKLQPDEGVLQLDASFIGIDVNGAMTGIDKKTREIVRLIIASGLEEKEIKTNNFQINKHTIYRHGNVKDSGFVASQSMHVKFIYSKEKVAKILNAFSKGKEEYQMYFNFIISDSLKKQMDTKLMKNAVKDAQQKAGILSAEAGLKIRAVKSIDYGIAADYSPYPIMNTRGALMAKDAGDSTMQDFTPNDIELHDEVLVVFEME